MSAVAPAAMGSWAVALERAGLVEDVEQPQDLAAVLALARSRQPWLPIGAGMDGAVRPERPVRLVTSRSLPVRVSIDEESGIARASAGARWSDIEARAAEVGWTTTHLVDIAPKATVGGTLARRALLPALWMANTVRGACIGLEGIGTGGQRYAYKEAPRTASGPDVRTFWIGSEGQGGLITRVSLELARLQPVLTVRVGCDRLPATRQRAWLEQFAARVSVVGGDRDALLWSVRGTSSMAARARERMLEFGEEVEHIAAMPGPCALVSVPWALWDRAWAVKASPLLQRSVHAAGPTHVVLRAEHPTQPSVAMRWRDRVAGLPLTRSALRGVLESTSAPGRLSAIIAARGSV